MRASVTYLATVLSGLFEPIISRTVQELVSFSPDVVVPGHCTGWRAIHFVATALPTVYLSNVGTTLRFFAEEAPNEETSGG